MSYRSRGSLSLLGKIQATGIGDKEERDSRRALRSHMRTTHYLKLGVHLALLSPACWILMIERAMFLEEVWNEACRDVPHARAAPGARAE